MKKATIAKLALMGLMAGGIATGCSSKAEKPDETPTDSTPTTQPMEEAPAEEAASATSEEMAYSEIHDCAGKNTCKGLGGCKVSAEKLTDLATKAGVDADKAGEAHECGGLNNCKGLGGCSVDADKLAMLKAKLVK